VDPQLRGPLGGPAGTGEPGDVMIGGVVGRVIESNDPRCAPNDIVEGTLGWQDFAVAPARSLRRIDPALAPITTALYPLGLPGLTAYFGLLEIGRPQLGDTVVISDAAGAVGSLAGQIAKIKRCRAIGVVSSREMADFVIRELGFDGAVSFAEAKEVPRRLKELAPGGVDVYFDCVGGSVTAEVIQHLSSGARIAVSEQILHAHKNESEKATQWFGQLVMKQASAAGFQVRHFADRFDPALKQLAAWLRENKLRYRVEILNGLENAPGVFIGILKGSNVARQLVKVAD
jgi:NADPH-dependent curcumin reductase CurA